MDDPALRKEIEALLGFHRFTADQGNGYWVTMRVRSVDPTPNRPFGLKYALTLHGPDDDRILGYDNAHPVSSQTGPARKSKMPIAYDHIDERGKPSKPYRFTSPLQLLADFWTDVNRLLDEDPTP